MPSACSNRDCGLSLGGTTTFCPFCGAQQSVKQAKPSGRFRYLAFGTVAIFGIFWLLMRGTPTVNVTVVTTPAVSGDVEIDGAVVGHVRQTLPVSIGMHTIGIIAPGWQKSAVPIDITRDRKESLNIKLLPLPAIVQIETDPANATVDIDSQRKGNAPLKLELPPGPHTVVVSQSGFDTKRVDINVRADERKPPLEIVLTRPAVHQTIIARPDDWSPPITIPTGTSFMLTFTGRLRIRSGGKVYLLRGDGNTNLGDQVGGAIELKAVDTKPVSVDVYLRAAR